ncbi:Baculoviral IAP repeat-containing protein 7 [Bulinus truncatus]|nr:Baculoviral IAP repeat-containing protein 7 [Bulinus truncatus]
MLLAENGFVYIGSGSDDSVLCIFCHLVKKKWKLGDIVTDVHRALSPSCPKFARSCKRQGHIKSYGSSNHNSLIANPKSSLVINAVPEIIQPEHHTSSTNQHDLIQTLETDAACEIIQPEHTNSSTNPHDSFQTVETDAEPEIIQLEHTNSSTNQHDSPQTRQNTCIVAQCTDNIFEPTTQSDNVSNEAGHLPQGQEVPRENTSVPTENSTPRSSQSQSSVTPAATSANTDAQAGPSENPSGGAAARENVTSRSNQGKPSYLELGIITERPKRTEYSLKLKRFETYSSWPRDHHLQPEELSDAGFYYAGYGDCTRCFYCGGGLRNWEDEDDVWVEHARWFPKCAFIRQQMGQSFVDTVQQLNKEMQHIPFKTVAEKMGVPMSHFHKGNQISPLKRDPAVLAMEDLGYLEKDVLDVAMRLKEETNGISSDSLFDKLNEESRCRNSASDSLFFNQKSHQTIDYNSLNQLKEANNQLRQQLLCKVCLDKEVAVTFLPCGHLVSCADCASAMKDCPLCRNHVRGIVRAFLC